MQCLKRNLLWIFTGLTLTCLPVVGQTNSTATNTSAAKPAPVLMFDSELKEYSAQVGEKSAPFIFNLTNVSSSEVIINSVQTSCGCTAAKLPSQPWHLAPSTSGQIQVTVDLNGKMGIVQKTVTLHTSVGARLVTVKVNIPTSNSTVQMTEEQRQKNAQLAQTDRQAVFRGNCADCHAKPAMGKMGADLYAAACGVCHETPRRASMVPDLHALKKPGDFEYWKNWISHGKTNSLMPAFAISEGGPLTEAQINSLASMLNRIISRNISTTQVRQTNAAVQVPQQSR